MEQRRWRPPQGALRLRRLERMRNCGTADPVGHKVADGGPAKVITYLKSFYYVE